MTNEKLYEAIGDISDKKIKEAKQVRKAKQPIWLKWGAMAACLCLVISSVTLLSRKYNSPNAGSEYGLGGVGSETNYSVWVGPATVKAEDVASAEVVSLTESEAMSNPLAEYLPKELPDGFHYGRGSIYNTVMKDGTQYNMLRVEYVSGTIPEQQFSEDGGAIAPAPETIGDLFTICVMNYEPETKNNIYSSIDEITVSLFENSGSVCIRLEDCHINVFAETADPAVVFEAVKNISKAKDTSDGAPLAPDVSDKDLESISHIEVMSGLTGQKITVKDADSVQKVMSDIESLSYEKKGEVESAGYAYRIRFYNENYDELGMLFITEENGHQISYDGYYYLVEADQNIDVDYLEELLKDAPPAESGDEGNDELLDREPDETITFHDKTFNKSDLSQETIEWLENYNNLSEEELLAISYIPSDLYELCGYPTAEETEAPVE